MVGALSAGLAKIAQDNPIMDLVKDAVFVGFSVDINYTSITILTNDFWKNEAKGIPHNSFLIAASPEWLKYKPDENGKRSVVVEPTENNIYEVILLRVSGEYDLPNKDTWFAAKIDKLENLKTSEFGDIISFDELSQQKIQYAGLECRVLGTFYLDSNSNLCFGADLENFYGSKVLFIYKPSPKGLECIVNFETRINQKDSMVLNKSELVSIGHVRYTSTVRLQNSEDYQAQVFINPDDFVNKRTALFGMTRTGKSNTAKILIKAINEAAQRSGKKIAQVVFDVNGEYIYPNQQDKGAVSTDIKDCYIYTLNPDVKETLGVEVLKFDFFKELGLAHEFITTLISLQRFPASTDLQSYLNLDMYSYMPENIDPEDRSLQTRANWIRTTYQYILSKILGRGDMEIKTPISNHIWQQISDDPYKKKITLDEWGQLLEAIHENRNNKDFKTTTGNPVYQDDFATLVNFAVKRNASGQSIMGYEVLRRIPLKNLHKNEASNYVDVLLEKVTKGHTVLIDMVYGGEKIRKLISEKIAWKIFLDNQKKFTLGEVPPYVIFYVEEAHNLIGKDMELTEIWPRIAKEGAKYNIGLVYSTQEPSSISKNILSNTENWFVTHLNNEDEIRSVTKYYDFEDFRDSLLIAKDKGFSRMKTFSQNFVCPVQIKKYEPEE